VISVVTSEILAAAGWLVTAWGSPAISARTPAAPGSAFGDGDRTPLLGPERIAALAPASRAQWSDYVQNSALLRTRDRAAMDAELRATGMTTMTPGPYLKAFRIGPEMTEVWFRGDEARRAADNMLTFQTPSGGWSKRIDVITRPRRPGESYFSENAGWTYIATIDNDATTEQIRFLAAAFSGHHDSRHVDSALRGIDHLLTAQFPNGCWPQGYPLQGGYHDAATFNDNAIVNVLRLLSDAAAGRFAFVPQVTRQRAAASVARGTECILASQVIVDGKKTVWAQQHDPLTLAPVAARSYELRGLCGRESAWITSYLMSLPEPDARVVAAVDAAVAWFQRHQTFGYEYEHNVLKTVAGAGPLWARLTDIETDRPMFSNRDGMKLYDWDQLTDRRQGYTWFSKEPGAAIDEYSRWKDAPGTARGRGRHGSGVTTKTTTTTSTPAPAERR
jgi:PelA/Pel-15E family pectate lyase